MKSFIFILTALCAACSPTFHYYGYQFKGGGRYIQGVPFYPQEENLCGPASLAGVMNYYGRSVTQQEVADAIFTPKIKGTITVDMVNYVKRKGFDAVTYAGNVEKIKEEIDRSRPLILYIDHGYSFYPKGHYLVVVGYNNDGVVVYSGKERDVFIPYNKLEKIWSRTGYWTLSIRQ